MVVGLAAHPFVLVGLSVSLLLVLVSVVPVGGADHVVDVRLSAKLDRDPVSDSWTIEQPNEDAQPHRLVHPVELVEQAMTFLGPRVVFELLDAGTHAKIREETTHTGHVGLLTTSKTAHVLVSGLSPGAYEVRIRVLDQNGETQQEATTPFTLVPTGG